MVLISASLTAQSPQGTITGTIFDSQGGRIAAAEIVARQMATGLDYRGVSGDNGTYAVPSLPIGVYEVTATAPGFKTFRRTGLSLEVAQRLRLDVALEIGGVNETVTVAAEISRIQTEDSSLGTTVETKRIEELPLNGRHVFNLVKIVPGVQSTSNAADGFADPNNQAFSRMRFNGGPILGNQFFLDGGMNTVPAINEISVVPMVDSVAEFRVETNGMKAEFGQTSGGVVNVVTKSGTNNFHGSLYEFFRNDSLDARNAFATQVNSITGRIKPILRYNQYGGTAGGPVLIPKIYDGRNRTFFFVGYEQWRHRSATLRRGTVPTPLERTGNFSNTRDARGALIRIFDPATTIANPVGSGFVRTPFAGNVVPQGRIDALSRRVLEFMPLPNAVPDDPFTNANNFISLASASLDQGVSSIRIDHRFSNSDNLFGRYTATRNTRLDPGWGLGPADPAARNDQRDNHNLVLSETHTFSPRVINEFKGAITRQWLPFVHPSFDQGWPKQLGYPALIPQDQFPPVVIAGMLGIGSASFAAGLRAQHTVQAMNSLTILLGRHTIKLGFDHRWTRLNFVNRDNPSGRFDFNAAQTGDPLVPAGTGFGLATFLLGEVTGGQQGYNPFFAYHSWNNGSYIQDDFKLTPKLTINIGLRYDYSSPPVERWNRYSNFDPYARNPQTGLPGALVFAGVDTPRSFVNRDRNNFGPRFGFAWAPGPDSRTVIRGAYGVIFNMVESGDTRGNGSNALGFQALTPFQQNGPFRVFQFSQGPSTLLQPLGAAVGPSGFRGQTVTYQDRNAPVPYIQQWNLTMQREVLRSWVATASYAGSRGVKLFGANYNLNQLDPKYFALGLSLQDLVANPFFGRIASGALAGATIPRAQLLRAYPDYISVNTIGNHGASSSYHSFQATVERRLSSNISALFAYTFAKLINDSSSNASGETADGDFRLGLHNRRLDRALDANDIRHRFVGSGVWELPFFANRKGVAGHLLGGWQLNGILTIQGGRPLRIRGANNFTGINWPDVLRDPTLPPDQRSVQRWFDIDAFRNPMNFVVGNVPRTMPRTRGPGFTELSASLFKNVQVMDAVRLEIRGEVFNALNNVNYNDPNTQFNPNAQGLNINAQFGRMVSALDARRIQLGLRLAW